MKTDFLLREIEIISNEDWLSSNTKQFIDSDSDGSFTHYENMHI